MLSINSPLVETLNRAIERLPVEEIFDHPSHQFKASSDRFRGSCLWHESQSGTSFVVNTANKLWFCAGCNVGGSAVDYLASVKRGAFIKARGSDFIEAVRELARRANLSFPEQQLSPEEIAQLEALEKRRHEIALVQNYCSEALWNSVGREAREYLTQQRGLTEDEIRALTIGYCDSAQNLKDYLLVKGIEKPICKGWNLIEGYITFLLNDDRGHPLTILGRWPAKNLPEGKTKITALPGENSKASPLYFDRVVASGVEAVVLVEGLLDAVLAQAKGDSRVCAYVGSSLGREQIKTIKRRRIHKVILCPDPDVAGESGTLSNIQRLSEEGIEVYVAPTLPDSLDPDEFLLHQGLEKWCQHLNNAQHGLRWVAELLHQKYPATSDQRKSELLEAAKAFSNKIQDTDALQTFFWPVISEFVGGNLRRPEIDSPNREIKKGKTPLLAKRYRAIKEAIGEKLRYNRLTKEIEFEGCTVQISELILTLAIEHKVQTSLNDCDIVIQKLAKEHEYHPVYVYLEGCSEQYGHETSLLEDLAKRYLGVSAQIYNTLLVKTLISAVARIYKPGCKVDTALILQGPQGIGKSSFFRILAGEWFDDSLGSISDKDERLKFHQTWFGEWAELESVFKRKDISTVKAFITSQADAIRPPYARQTELMRRSFIIVGTTNQDNFLSDTTGNRRFWVIPVSEQIDLNSLREERDRIWAAAVAVYKSGTPWWLSEEEEKLVASINREFESQDPWLVTIAKYLKDKGWNEVTTIELLNDCLNIDLGRQTKLDEMRVTDSLKQLGWQRGTRKKEKGKNRRNWLSPSHPLINQTSSELEDS